MTDGLITKLVNYGIKVDLTHYDVRRTREGGVPLWSAEVRNIIRGPNSSLGRYLADIKEYSEADKYVTFKFESLANGGQPVEVAGESLPANLSTVSRSELDGLRRAFESFKAQANEELRQKDPDRWNLINNFKLPNPKLDPQFFRVYGRFYRRRLLVLWGLERKPKYAGNLPGAVSSVEIFKDYRRSLFGWHSLFWGVPLLLLLLLLLAYLSGAICSILGVGCATPTIQNPLGQRRLNLKKSADVASLTKDGSVIYTFSLSNDGKTPISNAEVTDPKVSGLRCRFTVLDANSSQLYCGPVLRHPADLIQAANFTAAVAF